MTDALQSERQLFILSLLSENKNGLTLEQILKELSYIGVDVSKRTVERDLDCVTYHFCIHEEEKNGGIYYYANKYQIENLSFTLKELIALYFSKEMLKPYLHTQEGATSIEVINKITASLPALHKEYLESLRDLYKFNSSVTRCDKEINSEILNIIREAIYEKNTILLEYHSFNKDELTLREYDPYFIEMKEGVYHIIGYCHLRNEIRDLRISRIVSIKKLEKKFKRPENFYENYKKTRFDKLSGNNKIDLKLKFNEEAGRYIKEYELEKADIIEELPNGEITFKRKTALTDDVVNWILSYGSKVEVLEPPELRSEIKEIAKKVLEKYI